MKYRQMLKQDEDTTATGASLKIDGQWIEGRLLDKDGSELHLPCKVKKGETYIVEVDKES